MLITYSLVAGVLLIFLVVSIFFYPSQAFIGLISLRVISDYLGAQSPALTLASYLLTVGIVLFSMSLVLLRHTSTSQIYLLVALWLLPLPWLYLANVRFGHDPIFTREYIKLLLLPTVALAATVLQLNIGRLLRLFTILAFVPMLLLRSDTGDGRDSGAFVHANVAGAYFAVVAIGVLSEYLKTKKRSDLVFLAVASSGVIYSKSVGGAAALVVGMFLYLTLTNEPAAIKARKSKGVLGAVGVGLLAVGIVTASRISEWSSTTSLAAAGNGAITNSVDWRFFTWIQLIRIYRGTDIWFGMGLGVTLGPVQPTRFPPHSELVRMIVEGGLIGSLLVCLTLALLVKLALRRAIDRSLPLALLGGLFVNALWSNTMNYVPAMLIAGLLIGNACSYSEPESSKVPI